MLTYSFENIETESMYEYLYRCIKKDILDKKLVSHEKLPSKRAFAKNLGVSNITVESAYAQLVAEGYLY
ncbi:MAG: winged helix-turn-helix domain-containing protein, partial [Evtepia sp.]